MRLFLVRHAKAASAAPSGGPDELRPLTTEGRDAARGLGLRLADEHPDAILSSPLLRARETAAAIASAASLTVEVDERLAPGATAAGVLAAIEGKGETVVTVGHQPDCSEIVFELTGEEVNFPVGAAYEVSL